MNSALTSIFIRSSFILQERISFILSALPIVIQSLLYCKIRCIGHVFRSPHRAPVNPKGMVPQSERTVSFSRENGLISLQIQTMEEDKVAALWS